MNLSRSLSLAVCPVILSALAVAQQPAPMQLLGFTAPPEDGRMPVDVTLAGDLDRDGFADLAIGRPEMNGRDGGVEIRSGRDGRVLRTLLGVPGAREFFGAALGTLGDLDGDGQPELAVTSSSAQRRGLGVTGRTDVFSSRDWRRMRTEWGIGDGDLFGMAIAKFGDIDGDGIDDYGIGAPENGNAVVSYDTGYARIFSGRDGREIRLHEGVEIGDEFGATLAGIPDITGDGRPDYMVGSLLERAGGRGQGSVRVYSGADGSVVHAWFAPPNTDHFSVSLGALGDRDGDGIPELFVTSIGMTSLDTGAIHLFDATSGQLVERVWADGSAGVFGRSAAAPGDVTGDGIPDLIIGDPGAKRSGTRFGAFHVVSGADLSIVATRWGIPGNAGYGRLVKVFDDLDHDGRPELAISYPGIRRADGSLGWRAEVMTTAGDVATPGAGCGSGPTIPTLDSTGARVGSSVPLWLSGASPDAGGALLVSVRPDQPTALPSTLTAGIPDCTLYLALPDATILSSVAANASGRWLGWMAIPGDPTLAGAELALQTALFPGGTRLELSRGLFLRIRP